MKKICSIIFLTLVFSCNQEITEDEHFIETLLKHDGSFETVLEELDKYEIQILYTQINRGSANHPSFKSFYFNVDPDRYFYPASTVKMPTSLVALEKLQKLEIPDLNRNTTMLTDSAYSGQTTAHFDSTSKNGLPSVAHYIKKIFVVSDNDAYNRLYEFIGQQNLNMTLNEKGFHNTRLIHRLSIPLLVDENQHTNPIRFMKTDSLVYEQPLVKSKADYHSQQALLKGVAHLDQNDSLIESPFNFTYKNFMPLEEMQNMLRSVIFPEPEKGFDLQKEDRNFVLQYMSQLPRETTFPEYSSNEYHDGFSKFLMFGTKKNIPNGIRIFNKIGQAYGYMIDNAYIVDFNNNIEFFLSAVIHVNDNQIYNDGIYEYDDIGYPFMQRLGEVIHNYEVERQRQFDPDLSSFKLSYDK